MVQLERKNYFSLNDRLVDLIPELQYSDPRVKQIIIKEVLIHTSGLPDVIGN